MKRMNLLIFFVYFGVFITAFLIDSDLYAQHRKPAGIGVKNPRKTALNEKSKTVSCSINLVGNENKTVEIDVESTGIIKMIVTWSGTVDRVGLALYGPAENNDEMKYLHRSASNSEEVNFEVTDKMRSYGTNWKVWVANPFFQKTVKGELTITYPNGASSTDVAAEKEVQPNLKIIDFNVRVVSGSNIQTTFGLSAEGNLDAPFSMRLVIGREKEDYWMNLKKWKLSATNFNKLRKGTDIRVTDTFPIPDFGTGEYTIWLETDIDNSIKESNESDNDMKRQFQVAGSMLGNCQISGMISGKTSLARSVALYDTQWNLIKQVQIQNGRYEITNIKEGSYYIKPEAGGKVELYSQPSYRVIECSGSQNINQDFQITGVSGG